MPDLDTDHNLLFGVISLQSGLIDMQQFVDACTLWSGRQQASLAAVLVEQGWLEDDDRKHVDYLLRRRLEKEGRNASRTLAGVPDAIKVALASINSPSIHQSLQALPAGDSSDALDAGDAALETLAGPAGLHLHGKVTLRGLHSTGGIGQVWRAFDEVLGREIALKELKADTAGSRRNRERFFREAQLTGQLEHPGIVPVYDFVSRDDDGRCFYTMRFVRGRTLTEAIQQYHQQREADSEVDAAGELLRLLNVFVSICQTIAFAHSRNVIHRDLKGDNVILGDFGEVIVLDWGLAKRLDEPSDEAEEVDPGDPGATLAFAQETTQSPSVTMQGEKLGTPAYMAPEQATGQIDLLDRRTDVYGLAAILYEILTGQPPFLGKSIVEILQRVIHSPPQPLTERCPAVPIELERVCLQGLAKNRDDRQQTATEMANQIQQWIAERAQRKRTEQERGRFFNLSLDLLAIVNAQGTLLQTNPAWKKVLGWDSAELDGKTIMEILHPDEHHRLAQDLNRILAGEALTSIEHRCRCRDGSLRWILFNASLIAGEGAIYIVGRDITDRKQSEQTFQELLESAPDAMVIVNAGGTIVLANAQLQRLFGFSRDELLGQPIEVLVPEEIREKHPEYVARFVANPDFRPMASGLSLNGRRKDGTVFPAEISLSPVQTEQGLLISCAVRNVSERITRE